MAFNIQQIMQVTSESLQAKVRELLPSQQGFGADLQASNVIVPIVDLTAAAEGSGIPEIMQQALSFGSQTAFDVSNTTSTLVNNTGFYRVFGAVNVRGILSGTNTASFSLTDGLSTKKIYEMATFASSDNYGISQNVDFVVFLAAGESLTATSNTPVVSLAGSTRQIADVNGNLVNPSGYNPT